MDEKKKYGCCHGYDNVMPVPARAAKPRRQGQKLRQRKQKGQRKSL